MDQIFQIKTVHHSLRPSKKNLERRSSAFFERINRLNRRLFIAVMLLGTFWQGSLDASQTISPVPKKYNLSICAIIRNEATYLKEWIEYHRLVGVDHFYLYNIESKDRYFDTLKPYLNNLVTLIQWPNLLDPAEKDPALCVIGSLLPALENATKYRALHETKWLVFVDIDEFLVPPTCLKLPEILEKYKEYPGVILSSDFFNAAKVHTLPEKKLVIESTSLAPSPPQTPQKTVLKTIFKPELTCGFTWPPYEYQFKDNQKAIRLKRNELRINQYTNRNIEYFYQEKQKHRLSIDVQAISENEKQELLQAYEIEDQEQAINRFVPEVLKRMGLSTDLNP